MSDVTCVYGAVHTADRGDAFSLSNEFDSAHQRLIYLRDHQELSPLETTVLEVAAQLDRLREELKDVLSKLGLDTVVCADNTVVELTPKAAK